MWALPFLCQACCSTAVTGSNKAMWTLGTLGLHWPGKRRKAHHSNHLKLDTTLEKRQWSWVGWTREPNVALREKSCSFRPRDIRRTLCLNSGLTSWEWVSTVLDLAADSTHRDSFLKRISKALTAWQGAVYIFSSQSNFLFCLLWFSGDDVIVHLWLVIFIRTQKQTENTLKWCVIFHANAFRLTRVVLYD